jgi:hypothetical protein
LLGFLPVPVPAPAAGSCVECFKLGFMG